VCAIENVYSRVGHVLVYPLFRSEFLVDWVELDIILSILVFIVKNQEMKFIQN